MPNPYEAYGQIDRSAPTTNASNSGNPYAAYGVDNSTDSTGNDWGADFSSRPPVEKGWSLDFNNRLEAGVQESFATLWGGLGMMSDIVGLDGAKEYTMNRSNELFDKAADHDFKTTSFKDISNVTDLATFLTEGVIGVIPDIAGTVLGGAGVATGLAKLGGKAIVRKSLQAGAKKSLLKNIAKARTGELVGRKLVGDAAKEAAYKATLKSIGGMAGVGGYTAATGAGGMYSTDYNMNGDATSPYAALGGGVAQGAITLFNPFSKVLAGIAAKKGVKEIGSMAIGEALEEVSQGAMEKLHLAKIDPNLTVSEIFNNPDTYWELAEAGVLGAFVGGVFGGVGSKLNSKEEAASFIKKGEDVFGDGTTSFQSMEEFKNDSDPLSKFKKEWKVAEGNLKRSNKKGADNNAIWDEMVRGAEKTTPPITIDEVSIFQSESSKYVKDSNRFKAKPSFTNMIENGSINDVVSYLDNAKTNTEMDEAVRLYQEADNTPAEVRKFEKLVNAYRKKNNIKKLVDIPEDAGRKPPIKKSLDRANNTQDSLDYQTTGTGFLKDNTPVKTTMSPEEVLINRENRAASGEYDSGTFLDEASEGVAPFLEDTPDAAIKYASSFGNPEKTIKMLKGELRDYSKNNPQTEMAIEDNIKAVEESLMPNRGVARDLKTGHKWEPYKVGDEEYGDWLQVEHKGQKYALVKSPKHGNNYILTKNDGQLAPLKGTSYYTSKKIGKAAFEKLFKSKSADEKKTGKGTKKGKSYTRDGEMDKEGIPVIKREVGGIYKSSDGKYRIENDAKGAGHSKFYIYKDGKVINNGLPFKTLGEATKAYKTDRANDASALKAVEKAKGKPTVIRRKKSKIDDAKSKRLARKRAAKANLARESGSIVMDNNVIAEGKSTNSFKPAMGIDSTYQAPSVPEIRESKKAFDKALKANKKSGSVVYDTDVHDDGFTAHPDVEHKYASYIKSLLEMLNLDTRGIYVLPSNIDTNTDIPFSIEEQKTFVKNSAKANGFFSNINNVFWIDTSRGELQVLSTIAHEVFHKFHADVISNLTTADKAGFVSEYNTWVDKLQELHNKGDVESITKMYGDIYSPAQARESTKSLMKSIASGKIGKTSAIKLNGISAVTAYPEFMAHMGAKWVAKQQGKKGTGVSNILDKVFGKLAKALRKIYSVIVKRDGEGFTSDTYDKFMSKYLKDPKSYHVLQNDEMKPRFGTFLESKSPVKNRSLSENKKFIASKENKKAKLNKVVKDWTDRVSKTINDYTEPINERLRKINVKLKAKMNSMERKINMYNNKYLKTVQPFVEKLKKLDKDTQELIGIYLHNTNLEGDYAILTNLLEKNGLLGEYKKVEGILDKIYDRSETVGLNIFKKKDHYFPRRVRDIKGLMKYLNKEGVDAGPLDIIIKNENLSDVQKNEMIMQAINTNRLPESALKATTASNKRTINRVDAEMSKFYENSIDSLINHIHESNQKIEAHALLGKTNHKKLVRSVNKLSKQLKVAKGKGDTKTVGMLTRAIEKDLLAIREIGEDVSISEDSVSSFLAQEGLKLGDEDTRTAIELIRSRLNQRGMNGIAGDIRNIGLVTALGSYLNTLTQIGDLPWIIYKFGLKNASEGILGKKEISMDDLDLTQALKEFSQEGTSKYVDKVLKATGFEFFDQFAKRSTMQSALVEARGMSKEAFVKKNTEMYGKDMAGKIHDDIMNKSKTEDMIQYVFDQLSEIQPISLSEMPSKYLTAGNGRIFYSLKSYGMKQLSNIRREGLEEYKKGNKTGAFKNMLKLIPLLVLSNASIDELKDWLLGKDEPFEDHVMDNLLKLAFMSRYTLDKGSRDGMMSSVLKDLISPPGVRLADTFMKDIGNTLNGEKDTTYKSMENIPLLGKLIYKWTPEGREKEFEMQKRNIREDLRDAIKGGSSLNSIRSRIARYNNNLPSGTKRIKYSIISEIRKDIRRKKVEMLRG